MVKLMRFLPQSGREWASLALLPFKVYTVVAAPAVFLWVSTLPRRGLVGDVGATVVAGYVLSGLLLCIIGFHQVFTPQRNRGVLNLLFGGAGLFLGLSLARLFSPG
jgi:hypothetical protein